jgi:hypothetical protein
LFQPLLLITLLSLAALVVVRLLVLPLTLERVAAVQVDTEHLQEPLVETLLLNPL